MIYHFGMLIALTKFNKKFIRFFIL